MKLFEKYADPVSMSADDYSDRVLNMLPSHKEIFTSIEIKWMSDNFSNCEWYNSDGFPAWNNISDNSCGFFSTKGSGYVYIWKMEDEWFYVSLTVRAPHAAITDEFYKCDGFGGLKLLLKQCLNK